MYKKLVVSLEGNIGAGKSTLLEYFRKDKHMTIFPEPIEIWKNYKGTNLFKLFMENPVKWAYPFQCLAIQTLLDNQISEISTPIRIIERSIFSTKYCFIKTLVQDKIFQPVQVSILEEWFTFLKQTFPLKIDLIIYLKTSPEVALQRIKNRKRQEESEIDLNYIQRLHDLHECWLAGGSCLDSGAEVEIVNADLTKDKLEGEFHKLRDVIINLSQSQ